VEDKWKRNKSLTLAESRIYKRCKASLVEVEEKYIKKSGDVKNLGTVGATLADGVAPMFSICDRYADNVSHEAGLARFWQNVWQNKLNI